MNVRFRRSLVLLGVLVIASAGSHSVRAQATQPTPPAAAPRPQASVELGFGATDNLNRDASEIRSDITILGAAFSASRDQQRLRGALAADVEYRKYGAEQFADDDEVLGSIDGLLDLHIVPERFRWDVRSSFGQVRTDSRAAISPENRQRTTVTSMGPSLTLPFSGRNAVELAAQVAERRYETTEDLDSRLKTIRFGLWRDVSPVTRVSLTIEQSETEFDLQPETYEFDFVSVEYRKELASGLALLSVGRGEIEIGGVAESTAVARLAWNRDVATRSRIEVWAGRELTDAGTLFANGGAVTGQGPLSGLTDVTRTTDGRLRGVALSRSPLRRESAGTRFLVRGEQSTFSVSFGTARDRFETESALDNDWTVVELAASRQLGSRWQGEAALSRWDQDFDTGAGGGEDQTFRLRLGRSLGRASSLGVRLERTQRASTTDPFDENVFVVSLSHDFGQQ